MKDLLKTIVTGHMDIWKSAYVQGYADGKRDAWLEIKPHIEKLEKTAKGLQDTNDETNASYDPDDPGHERDAKEEI